MERDGVAAIFKDTAHQLRTTDRPVDPSFANHGDCPLVEPVRFIIQTFFERWLETLQPLIILWVIQYCLDILRVATAMSCSWPIEE